jgi:hypothetical protein
MLYYILYYDPSVEMVGPFTDRQQAVEWALVRERRRERPTLWVIAKSMYARKRYHILVKHPMEINVDETRPA